MVSDDAPKGHVDDPDDKSDKSCESGREGHEDGANTRVASAAEAKDCGKEGEYGCYWVEDHGRSQVVDSGCVKTIIAGEDMSVLQVREVKYAREAKCCRIDIIAKLPL